MFSHAVPNAASHNPVNMVIQSVCSPFCLALGLEPWGSLPSFALGKYCPGVKTSRACPKAFTA